MGASRDFQGSHQIVLPNSFSAHTVGAISLWVRPETIPADASDYIVGISDSGDALSLFGLHVFDDAGGAGGKKFFIMNVEAVSFNAHLYGSTAISTNIWYHVVIQQTGSGYQMFLNGVQETLSVYSGRGSVSNTGWISYVTDIDSTLLGDALISGAHYYLDGQVADVRIYSAALTASQIKELASGKLNAVRANLAGEWRLDDQGADPTYRDLSGNGNTGSSAADPVESYNGPRLFRDGALCTR